MPSSKNRRLKIFVPTLAAQGWGNRQVLREADPSLTTPKLKNALGAPCAQDDSR
jgi:hypothetical protein